jgi:hypothetical protein
MLSWEKFATFADIGELEHVCELFETAKEEQWTSLADLAGENSHLVIKLVTQDMESAAILEAARPGLYQKTWIAHLFRSLYVRLDELADKPYLLHDELPALLLDLHKVLIAAHDIYDPSHRAALIEKATASGIEQGKDEEKNRRSEQSRNAVAQRADQKVKADFTKWVKEKLAAGAQPATINELQEMEGFNPAWSAAVKDQRTLRAWATKAGVSFKSGRPKKKI